MIQFWMRESAKIFLSLKTKPISSYFTLASGGYIIKIKPMAIGSEVVPIESELINCVDEGEKTPRRTPMAMARKIHNVKYESKKDNFFIKRSQGFEQRFLFHL